MLPVNAQLKLTEQNLFFRFVCECDLNVFLELGGSSRVSDSNGSWHGAMPRRRKAFTLACQREPDSSSEVRRAGFSVATQRYSVTQCTDGICASNLIKLVV